MNQLLYSSAVVSIVMSSVGCTQQAADPRQASLDDFCKQFPMSASCPEGKNVIRKQNAFCAEFQLSVTCPDGRAAIQTKHLLLLVSEVCQLPRGKSSDGEKDQVVHRLPKFCCLQLSNNPPYHTLPNSIPLTQANFSQINSSNFSFLDINSPQVIKSSSASSISNKTSETKFHSP